MCCLCGGGSNSTVIDGTTPDGGDAVIDEGGDSSNNDTVVDLVCHNNNTLENGTVLTDEWEDGCTEYAQNPQWCGNYDTDTFKSLEMCCACGGGVDEEPIVWEECVDTDDGATDNWGDGCAWYTENPDECGNFNNDSFTSESMCCACMGLDNF